MAEEIDDTETFTIALTPPEHIPKFSVGDYVCTTQSELTGYSPAVIDVIYDDGSCRAIPTNGSPFKMSPDWEEYFHICTPSELDPCTGVTCSNTCDVTSLYSQKCVNGVCVNDTLIEANSPTCGYVPLEDEPDDTPEDEPDPGEPEPEPEDDDDIYSLFGDIKPIYIIIAAIAIIILGILS